MGVALKVVGSVLLALYGLLLLDVEYVNDVADSLLSNTSFFEEGGTGELLQRLIAPDTGDLFDKCILMDIPTWTPALKKMLNPSSDPFWNCNRSFVPWTFLDGEGRVVANRSSALFKGIHCFARAILHNGDYKIMKGEWIGLEKNHSFENDIVEVECRRDKEIVYQFLHYQTWRNTTDFPSEERNETGSGIPPSQPSVYVILFDSISASHGRRVFPRTISFLQEAFGAVDFDHINKVGDNSRPNGVAFLFGRRISPLRRDVFGEEEMTPPEWPYANFCKNHIDNEGFIMKEFSEQGYATLMAEDWSLGVFNWPGCWGFKDKPTTHYMRPFQLRFEKEKHPDMNKFMNGGNCMEHHKFLLEYLDKFIGAYPDKPKFGLTWASYLGHDKADMPFHADNYLLDFFTRNKEEFDRSFVFFMGDHGLRFGRLRWSDIGQRDVKNPMLHLSIPRHLRDNANINGNMAKNSKELLTMFDIHATFRDILQSLGQEEAMESEFDEHLIFNKNKGSSLLRPLPSTPRNCKTLPIPFEYCLCEIEKIPVTDAEVAGDLADVVASVANQRLQDEGVTDLCSFLSVDRVLQAYQFKGSSDLYGVEVVLTPGGGKFETFIRHIGLRDYKMIVADALRMNSYGRAADCVDKNSLRPYCFCKQGNSTMSIGR